MANTPSSRRSYSLVDLGAAVAVALAVGGVVWSPKLSGAIASATGAMQPVIVTVDVRGVPAADAPSLVKSIEEEGNVSVVIRNQPHGTVAVKQVLPLERRISTLSPDGRVVSAPDPNQKTFGSFDARLVLEGQGRKTAGGVVFGNQTIKIGAPVELEGSRFRFGGSVTDLQLGQR